MITCLHLDDYFIVPMCFQQFVLFYCMIDRDYASCSQWTIQHGGEHNLQCQQFYSWSKKCHAIQIWSQYYFSRNSNKYEIMYFSLLIIVLVNESIIWLITFFPNMLCVISLHLKCLSANQCQVMISCMLINHTIIEYNYDSLKIFFLYILTVNNYPINTTVNFLFWIFYQ